MNPLREGLFSQFNIQVTFGEGQGVDAGFQEISGLTQEVNPSEWREGQPAKISGSYKVGDVTLKRGVIGDVDTLYSWLQQAKQNDPRAGREVSITQVGESGLPVKTWKLTGARPVKYTGPTLSGKGTDVAIEELEISCEGIKLVEG